MSGSNCAKFTCHSQVDPSERLGHTFANSFPQHSVCETDGGEGLAKLMGKGDAVPRGRESQRERKLGRVNKISVWDFVMNEFLKEGKSN